MRVGSFVYYAPPFENRKACLGSWDMPIRLLRRVASLGVRGASQSIVVFSNIVVGSLVSNNSVVGSWALRNSAFEVEIS